MAIDFGPMRLGTSRTFTLSLKKGDGTAADLSAVTAYDAVLAPGSGLPAVATLTASTLSAPAGTVTVVIDDGAILGLVAGTYHVFVTATVGGEPIDASGEATVELTDGPGTAPAASDTLTYAEVEADLGQRVEAAFKASDLPIDFVGGNRFLRPVVAKALRWVGISPTNPLRPTDADCARLTGDNFDEFADIAFVEGLDAAVTSYFQVGYQVSGPSGEQTQQLQQFRQDFMKIVQDKRDRLKIRYGYGAATLTAGSIGLGFQAGDPDVGE